uniref:Gustatory receptor n=1 Tax=Panagrolaimus sp. JU765 TaxID=591449 RepID=A0AC34RLH5_9BILA
MDSVEVPSDKLGLSIWGPFQYIAIATGQVIPIAPKDVKSIKALFHMIPNVFVSVVLLANVIYTFVRLDNKGLSVNWMYSNSLSFIAIHAFVASLSLMGMKFRNYFDNVEQMLRKATKNELTITKKRRWPVMVFRIIYSLIIIASMAFYCAETFLLFDVTVVLPRKLNVSHDDIQAFRESMFGWQPLFVIDTIIMIYGAVLSAVALMIYLCANNATCLEYIQFNKNLKECIDDRSILKVPVIESFESQMIDFMSLMKFLTFNARGVLIVSFLIGVMLHFFSSFAVRAFKEYLMWGNVTFSLWIIVSLIFVVSSTYPFAQFYFLMKETQDMLQLDHEIFSPTTDDDVKVIAKNMISRLNTFDYGVTNIISPVSANRIRDALLTGLTIVVGCFIQSSYVPPFLIQVAQYRESRG